MISAFTFVHNALEGGYPIVEAIGAVQPFVDEIVAVDCESTDGTKEVLEKICHRVIPGAWGNEAGETLAQAHSMHVYCKHDLILHFEADEVYSSSLLQEMTRRMQDGLINLCVYRLQLEQNFQRCRWYPELVHRVFPRASCHKEGHTTSNHSEAAIIGPEYGFLWDCTNCFRDNWFNRVHQQARLWRQEPQYKWTPLHFMRDIQLSEAQAREALKEEHWTWRVTPFNIPLILKPLVGETKYRVTL